MPEYVPKPGVQLASGAWPRHERRRFPRRTCILEGQIAGDGYSANIRIADVSISGCYVEMLSPLPKGSAIEITLHLDEKMVRAKGDVVTSQVGFGMGIAFTWVAPED